MTSGIKLFSNARRARNSHWHPGHRCVIHSYLGLTELEPLISFFTLDSQSAPLVCLFVVVLPQVTWKELALAGIYRPGHHWCRLAPAAVLLTEEEGTAMSLKGAIWVQCIPSLRGCLGLVTSTSWQWGLGFAEQYIRNFDTYSRKNGRSLHEVGVKERLGPIYLALFYPFYVTSSWGF